MLIPYPHPLKARAFFSFRPAVSARAVVPLGLLLSCLPPGGAGSMAGGALAPTPPPAGAYVYVTMPGSASAPGSAVARIDTTTYAVDEIAVGVMPMGIAVTPDGSSVFVANALSGSISVIATATGGVVADIPTGGLPIGIAMDHAGAYLYVTDPGDTMGAGPGRTIVVSASSRTIVGEIPAGRYPLGVDVSSDDSTLAVGNYYDSTVWLIDTASREWVGEIVREDGNYPYDVKFGPGGDALYIAYSGDGSNDHVRAVDFAGDGPDLYYDGIGQAPVSICFDPFGAGLFVSNSHHAGRADTDNLYSCMLRAPGYAGTVRVSAPGIGAFTPDGARFFLPCRALNTVAVFDQGGGTLTPHAEIVLPARPYAAAIAGMPPAPGGEFVGAHLYANPAEVRPGGVGYLTWDLLPGDASFGADVLLGVVGESGDCYAFGPSLKQVRNVTGAAIGSIPRFVSGLPVDGPASGWIGLELRGSVPTGAYRFITALVSPPGSNRVVYRTVSNRFTVQ